MKLMTKEIESKLKKHPLYSTEGQGKQAKVIVKYFNPFGAGTWLITEGNQLESGDWDLYGYMKTHTWEWGYIRLSELMSVFGIERDLYSSGTVEELAKEG